MMQSRVERIADWIAAAVRTLVDVLLAVPLVLLARLLRPLVLIRFGGFKSGRFAHFAGDTEVYLCERDAGLHGRRVFDIFYYVQPIRNGALKTMWNRVLPVSQAARWAARLNRWLPGWQAHVVPWGQHTHRDVHNLLWRTKPHLSFTPQEEVQGRRMLRALGVPDGKPFVDVHAMDSAYRNSIARDEPVELPSVRDTDIQTYVPAMAELVRRGYVAIRMGAAVNTPLLTTHPGIIDYATRARNEFMDIFLCAQCHFFLGDTAGLLSIPQVFRRPLAIVNFICMELVWSWGPADLVIVKNFWLREERRFLTFREIIDSGLGRSRELRVEAYARMGLEVIDNTSDEITALAVEMDERLKGTWRSSEEDEGLQRRFWALYAHSKVQLVEPLGLMPIHGEFRSRVGAEFLRKHRALLEERLPSGPVVVTATHGSFTQNRSRSARMNPRCI